MGNYNDNRRSGGGGRGGFGGGRGRGGSEMHQATCSDCGKKCEVPFRPSAGKPVYCNDCFKRDGDAGSNRSDRSGGKSFGRKDFGRSNSQDRQMHAATCADCGNRCEVPFRPTNDKPVYCSDCFGGGKEKSFGPKKSDQSNEQFEQLNRKLDKILRVLEIISPKKTHVIEKPEAKTAEASDDAVKTHRDASPEKKTAKKAVKKKAPTKKKAPAKKKVKKAKS